MTKLKGKTVLVTGGATGIGRLIGDMCLQEGARQLVIWDTNKEKLDSTTQELRGLHFIVHPYLVDISDMQKVLELTGRVEKEVGRVDVLVNNASIRPTIGRFDEVSHEEIGTVLMANTHAIMHITRGFIGGMISNGSGHIVNISSAAGLLSMPGISVYCASAWAVSGWSESLRMELEMAGTGVRVTTVPVTVANVYPALSVQDPSKIAAMVVRAIKTNRRFVRSPWRIRLVPFLRGVLPAVLFDRVAATFLGLNHAKNSYLSRKDEPLK